MIKSMTGYGRAELNSPNIKLSVEIRSINHRYHDVTFKMPKDFFAIEDLMRKTIKEYVKRGRIDVYISLEKSNNSNQDLKVDWDLVNQYYEIVKEFNKRLNTESIVDLKDLLKIPEIIHFGRVDFDLEVIKTELLGTIKTACSNLVEMKMTEGNNLYLDLSLRIENLIKLLELMQDRAPSVVDDYRNKLLDRLSEWLDENLEIEESRILNEIAIFADKASIDEELTRLKSHFNQFSTILQQEEPVGRKLDFLIQEMNREVNTIGSKANDLKLSQLVVEMKSELEKMREQIQNVE